MKYIKFIVAICTILVFLQKVSFAQNPALIEINAIVVGTDNEPLKGAVVSSTSAQTVTDAEGAFTIQVPEDTALTIKAAGYKDVVVIVSDNLEVITMESDVTLVQLAFRKVDQRDVISGVSVIDGRELLSKNYTSHPMDALSSLVAGFNGNSIWGMEGLLVLVDGIPRDLNNVRSTEVDQIIVLKGAGAVALYGTHAVNGVINITTRRGIVGDQRVDVRVNSGMFTPKRLPDYLGAAEYMTFYNEARLNDNTAPQYTRDEIAATASGGNPYRYPDTDYYSSDYLKNFYNRSDATTEIYGGNRNARYYTNIGYMREGSLLDFGEGARANNQRFNLRGNVDMNLTNWLSAAVDAVAIFSAGRSTHTNYWEQASIVRPNRFSPLIPISMIDMTNDDNRFVIENSDNIIDGRYILGGTDLVTTNPIASSFVQGYNLGVNRQFMFNTSLDANLNAITPGLAFRTKMGIDYNTSYNQGYFHDYRVYQPIWANVDGVDMVSSLVPHGSLDRKSNTQSISNSAYQQLIYFSGQLDYQANIADRHNFHTMLVANGYQRSIPGVYHTTNNTSLGYFLGYNFLQRYYVDFTSSLMYSNRLAPGNRLSLSPVLSLGWRISDEAFMDGVTAIDNLKLISTIGRMYSDRTIEQHYLYNSSYRYKDSFWYIWGADMGIDVTAARRGENFDLKAPYRDELSVGFESTLFNRLIDVEANYFSITNGGGIIQAYPLFPNYWVIDNNYSFVPFVNYNEERRTGYDFNVRLNQRTSNVNWTVGVVGSFYDTEVLKRGDEYKYDYQEREGKPIDGVWGLQSAGFFADEADIQNSPRQAFGTYLPGDIKYIDQNNDGVINNDDIVFLGKGGWFGSPNTLGVNFTANWNSFTLFAQGVGRWGGYGIRNRTSDWVYGERKYTDVVYGRWAHYTDPVSGETIDTRASATYPRLSTQNSQNNFQTSDFWFYNNDRFDISRIQLTYSLPQTLLGNTFLRNVDVYLAGSNLFTFAAERKYLETNVGQAPQMRFYNFGLTAAF